jgi:hypothetical protein
VAVLVPTITYLSAQDGDFAVVTIRTYCTHDLSKHFSLFNFPSLLFDLTLSGTFWWLKAQTSYSLSYRKEADTACKHALPPKVPHLYCVDGKDPLLIPSARTHVYPALPTLKLMRLWLRKHATH